MPAYILMRLAYAVPVLLCVSLVCFLLVHAAPGDPLMALLPADAPAEVAEQVKTMYGLDQPLPVQYLRWLGEVLGGNLGTSLATGRAVAQEVWLALGNTLLLSLSAAAVGVTAGIVIGLLCGYFRDTRLDRTLSLVTSAGVSVPHYWLAMVLVIVFAVTLGWLPSMGGGEGGLAQWRWDWEHLSYLILPALSMAVVPTSIIARTLRAAIGEIRSQDFVEALHARGLRGHQVFRHVVKNAAPTALSVIGLQLGYLLGGSILIETVFSWPGTGFLLNAAIFQRDIPLLQGTVLVLPSCS
jgi:peptide/nickel transport system permease protein